jgi:hypothetical protein
MLCKEVLWMKNFLQELDMNQEKYTLYCDSQSAIHLAKNPSFHSQTKRIAIRYHWIWDVVSSKFVQLEKIHTDKNGSDMMKKILPKDKLLVYCKAASMAAPSTWVRWGNLGFPPHVGYQEVAYWRLLGGPTRCKIPQTFSVITKGHFGHCTWGEGDDKPPSSHQWMEWRKSRIASIGEEN